MAEQSNSKSNSNNTNSNNNVDQRKQDVPLYSPIMAMIGRLIKLIFNSCMLLMFLSTILFVFDYYHGTRGFERSSDIYRETLQNAEYMGDWFNIEVVFDSIVNRTQDILNQIASKFTEINQTSDVENLKNNFSKYSDKLLNNYNEKINSEDSFFFASWKGITEFLYYYLMDTLITLLTFILKILIVFNFLPVYFLLIIPGLANGYCNRKIATFTGELDKEDRVELAYSKLRIVSIAVMYFYVGIPHAYNPLFFLVPSAILSAIAVRFLARYYKKYW